MFWYFLSEKLSIKPSLCKIILVYLDLGLRGVLKQDIHIMNSNPNNLSF